MPATVSLTREGVGIGFEFHRGHDGRFDIWLDGNKVDSIEWHQGINVPVESGHNTPAAPLGPALQRDPQLRRGRWPGRQLPLPRRPPVAEVCRIPRSPETRDIATAPGVSVEGPRSRGKGEERANHLRAKS